MGESYECEGEVSAMVFEALARAGDGEGLARRTAPKPFDLGPCSGVDLGKVAEIRHIGAKGPSLHHAVEFLVIGDPVGTVLLGQHGWIEVVARRRGSEPLSQNGAGEGLNLC